MTATPEGATPNRVVPRRASVTTPGRDANIGGHMVPSVSVILPARNAAATLASALDSVRNQSLSDLEIIVIDDGSTDATASIAGQVAREDSRVVPLTCGSGLVDALNLGVAVARAPYVARMDADDACLPERFRLQKEHLDAHPDIGLVACAVAFGGDAMAARGYAMHVEWTNRLLDHDAISQNRFVESPLAHPSVMFRRELPARHGGYRSGPFPEDYELWLRWLEAGVRMAKLPEALLVWRDGPDRLSRRDARYARDRFFQIKAGYLARWLKEHNPHHPEIITWGAGRLARRRAEMLECHGIQITHQVDISPRLVGRNAGGRPVIRPTDIPRDAFVVVFVGTRGARELIRARLESDGRIMGRDFVLAA